MRWALLRWWRRTFRGSGTTKGGPGALTRSGWVVVGSIGLILGAFLLVEANMSKTILDLSAVEARQLAITTFSTEIERTIGTNGRDIFDVTTHGGQAFINVDTTAFDRESAVAALAIQKGLRRLPGDTIQIPLGQALGSKLLAGYGPEIPVRLIPYGALAIDFKRSGPRGGMTREAPGWTGRSVPGM